MAIPQEKASPPSTIYHIHIEQAAGIAIGDRSVIGHGGQRLSREEKQLATKIAIIGDDSGSHVVKESPWAGSSEAYRRLGDAPAAVADLKAAVKGIERVRGRLSRDEEKLTFFGEDRGAIYTRLVRLLCTELKRGARALAYAERERSRIFSESMAIGLMLSTMDNWP